MFSLIVIYLLIIASGWSVAQILALPTRTLRWSFAVAAGCAQLIASVQILSLFHLLRGKELLIANGVVTVALLALAMRRRGTQAPPLEQPGAQTSFREFLDQFGRVNLLAAGAVLIVLIAAAVAGGILFPATDPYHVNMCLFWKQNQGIQAFTVHDPRIISVVFAGEALAFPSSIYAGSTVGFIVPSLAAAILSAWLIYGLSRDVGASSKVAFAACLLFSANTLLTGSVVGGKSDFLFSTLWMLGSLHFLFATRKFPERATTLLACSVFLFAMACGSKNTILLHAPAYGFALLLILGRKLWRPRFILISALCGAVGLLASGVVWSYVQNRVWFGDWRGHPYLKETLAENFDVRAMWTRLARSVVTVVYDTGWLPGSLQPTYARLATGTVKALGGAETLPEDTPFYSFDPKVIRSGSGMGIMGPLIVFPSLIAAAVILLQRRRLSASDDADRYRALAVFTLLSFGTCYIFLRTQTIGVSRLTLPCLAVAMPLCTTILRTRIGYWIGMAAIAFSLLLGFVWAAGFAMYRLNSQAFPALTNLKRTSPLPLEIQWNSEPPHAFSMREPYTDRELYGMIGDQLRKAKVVGLIGGYTAEGYFCFGSDYANRVVALKDSRSETIQKPGPEVDAIVVEDFDPQQIDPAILQGYRPVFTAYRDKKPIFAYYEREPQE